MRAHFRSNPSKILAAQFWKRTNLQMRTCMNQLPMIPTLQPTSMQYAYRIHSQRPRRPQGNNSESLPLRGLRTSLASCAPVVAAEPHFFLFLFHWKPIVEHPRSLNASVAMAFPLGLVSSRWQLFTLQGCQELPHGLPKILLSPRFSLETSCFVSTCSSGYVTPESPGKDIVIQEV